MSIDLPRSSKGLHFTGALRALAPRAPRAGEREEAPRSVPSVIIEDIYAVGSEPTPYVGARPSERNEAARPAKLGTMRGSLASFDDELETLAIDRAQVEAVLFPNARREKPPQPAPNLTVPGFRSKDTAVAQQAAPPRVRKTRKGASVALGMWIAVALVAGAISYQVAPRAVERVAAVVRGER